jgi:hypothetical protein
VGMEVGLSDLGLVGTELDLEALFDEGGEEN